MFRLAAETSRLAARAPQKNAKVRLRGTRKSERFAHDPYWKDLVLFHEYFHADTGEGLGASHQTGWTALVASLIDEWRR